MSQADAVSEGAAAQEAHRLAPQAFLHAERLRREAHAAYRDDDLPVAQILSEHAIAAYSHAFVLARLAKAEQRREQARLELERAQQVLAQLDEQQQRVATEADDLEMRIKVARDAEPLAPNEPTSPKRERARLEAARSLALQARLLCTSTRLLDSKANGLSEDLKALDALDAVLAGQPEATPIDEAVRLRSACLERLTLTRRAATRRAPAAGAADALLAELGDAGGLFVFRDDRGVVVTLRGLFSRDAQLTPTAQAQLAMLGRVAKAHPDFPVLVVSHGDSSAVDDARMTAIVGALKAAGALEVEQHNAGDVQPVVDPARRGARERNTRVEIIFVAPTS
jgi:flagellar motor protein MotB